MTTLLFKLELNQSSVEVSQLRCKIRFWHSNIVKHTTLLQKKKSREAQGEVFSPPPLPSFIYLNAMGE